MNKIALHYKKDPGGLTSSGHVTYLGDNESTEVEFFGHSFLNMMEEVHSLLLVHPEAEVFFQRMDKPGLNEVKLDDTTRAQLLHSPVEAANALTHTVAPIHVRIAPKMKDLESFAPEEPKPGPVFRAGLVMLANAFGEEVYVRARPVRNVATLLEVECPFCGRWTSVLHHGENPALPDVVLRCDEDALKNPVVPGLIKSERWIAIKTNRLIDVAADRFYVPREWNNEASSWISRSTLLEMYSNWLKKKEVLP